MILLLVYMYMFIHVSLQSVPASAGLPDLSLLTGSAHCTTEEGWSFNGHLSCIYFRRAIHFSVFAFLPTFPPRHKDMNDIYCPQFILVVPDGHYYLAVT